MIRRPSYREFLNQTISSPSTQIYTKPLSGFSRPPLPSYKPQHQPLLSQTQTPQSKLSNNLSQFPSNISSLRQSKDYSTYSSAKKQNTESSITISSNCRLEFQGITKKAKPSKWRSSWQASSTNVYKELTQNYLQEKDKNKCQEHESIQSTTFLVHSKSKDTLKTLLDQQLERKKDNTSNKIQKLQKTAKNKPRRNDNQLSSISTTVLPTFIRNKSRSKTPVKVTSPQPSMTTLVFNKKKSQGVQDKNLSHSTDKEIQKTPRKETKSHFVQKNLIKISLNDFLMGKKLGEGRFGSVNMVIHKNTGAIFALKRIPKATLKEHMMIDQFALEVRLQAGIYHPNIVSVYAVFDDQQYVYLVLEYLSGGSLYGELKKKTTLTQQTASQRIRALCQAVQALHLRGVAHRDIKPENIIICNGVCKLGDFGWATLCDQRRRTYCGTTDYVSPEIVEGKEYGEGVDMWCVGILAYELLTGRPPFYHLSRKQTFRRIGEATPTFPNNLSKESVDFISRLLQKVPEERMSAKDALQHSFLTKYSCQ